MRRIAVVGAGAIGGIVSARLTDLGQQVVVICKHDDLARTLKQDGIQIGGVSGNYCVRLDAKPRVDQLVGPQDVVFLATKAMDAPGVARDLIPYLHVDSIVVTMQNGIVEEMIGELVGYERIIGCVVHWGSTVTRPGVIEQTSHGLFVIGELDGSLSERIEDVKQLLERIEPVIVSRNIFGALYTKLVINSCITSLGALCGLYLGEMLAMRRARELFLGIINEAVAVAESTGLVPEKIENLDLYRLAGSPDLLKHLFIRVIGLKYRRLKSSSLQSLERGRPTEVDYLNGYIVRRGEEAGVETPINRNIVTMIEEIERGDREISAANINVLFERTISN